MATNASAPPLLTVAETAAALRVCTRTVWHLLQARALDSVLIGRRCRRVTRASLERLMAAPLPSR